ncbi:FAD-binding oxidoreductase [Mesorhizobium sp. ES1-3]|uniref:FAD-binding oxidoreductase n=1 Tax=Mesorhizobium sp. ES1-3 TaxID=2876628 RepID=UPI001CC9EB3E|nr:FAD-binding oxidoreductase [Mesorhizobium sp. ES1-3]MBZ9674034.1 FAD-binding oxidoreductase [Mesorhizobium sp. ES1-3]
MKTSNDEALSSLQTSLRGQLIAPGHAGYDTARAVYNAMIDRRPAAIVRCADVADVMAAVDFAREHGLVLAVRGGGHSGPGLGTCDGGLVIDLSAMRGIRVDPAARAARAEGGCTWGDLDHATHPFGLAVPGGFISTTGIGGLTLGGGVGYLSRACGFTVDNLLSVDMVLADGSFVVADEAHDADLFWAVRGGGGNFGVVTAFEYRLSPAGMVYGGPMLWPLEEARAVMTDWRDLILKAPEALNGWFGLMMVPPAPQFPPELHGKIMCTVVWCHLGTAEEGEAALTPFRAAHPPALDFAGPLPWPALQSMFDELFKPGLQWYWKSDFVTDLGKDAIDLHLKHGTELPTMLSTMHLYPINGAAHRPMAGDTAFAYRDANFVQLIAAIGDDPSDNDRMIDWARTYWHALHPHSAGGGYVNMNMAEDEDRIRESYGGNYARLAAIKAKYDPDNLFRINQNIRPAHSDARPSASPRSARA